MTTKTTEARRASFRKIFANPPYEFSMARYAEDNSAWPGNYVSYHVECAWQAYNAALESLCVTLPDGFTYHGGEDMTKYVLDADHVVEALTAAGVPYK